MGTAIPFGPINGEEHTVTATPNPWEPWMIAFIGMMVAAAGTAIAGWRRLTVLLGCSPGALVVAYGLYAVTEPRGARVADAQSQTTGPYWRPGTDVGTLIQGGIFAVLGLLLLAFWVGLLLREFRRPPDRG